MDTTDPGTLASRYLLAAREGGAAADEGERRLARLTPRRLAEGLPDDAARIAFWVNVYNAAVVRAGLEGLSSSWGRWQFFRRPVVVVAGEPLSLDAIEHGLLRRSRWRFSLGYLVNPRPGRFERMHRVGHVDARIHFALNCGAASCPPIASYDAKRIDAHLDLATRSYLHAEVVKDGRVIRVPMLLLWYLGDFGGPAGIRRLLRRNGIEGWGGRLRFRAYDWTPTPGQWVRDPDEAGR